MSHLQQTFLGASAKSGRKKSPPPFSLRLSKDERDQLETAAAGMPLGPSGFDLPDPRPSFAPPDRKWREDGWFQKLNVHENGTPLKVISKAY